MTLKTVARSKRVVLFFLFAVVGSGLVSRKYPFLFPSMSDKYPGDALWAMMVFLAWAYLKPVESTGRLSFLALATSYCVEFSQLYEAPWINAIHSTTAGHLVLGSTFSWWDMLAYTVGIAFSVGLDRLRIRNRNLHSNSY